MHWLREESGKEICLVADIESLGTLDASEIHARRLNAEEVTSRMGAPFTSPTAGRTAQLLGRYHEIRESTPRQYQLVGSEDLKEELQRNSERSQPTETKDDAEARNDFWSMEGDFIHRGVLQEKCINEYWNVV